MKIKLFVLALAACLAMGCATVPLADEAMDLSAKKFIPNENKANIYIFRKKAFFASGVLFPVRVDGRTIGSIAPGTYFMAEVETGEHSITISAPQNTHTIKMVPVIGNSYFFSVKIKANHNTPRATFKSVSEANGKKKVNKSKRARGNF